MVSDSIQAIKNEFLHPDLSDEKKTRPLEETLSGFVLRRCGASIYLSFQLKLCWNVEYIIEHDDNVSKVHFPR